MLIEFSVKNFLSFKEKSTLLMNANSGNENKENYINFEDTKILKSAAIYGSNASGKSNFLKAIKCAINIIRSSHLIPEKGVWKDIIPFLFNEETSKKPTEFEFIVFVKGIKYRYFFSMDKATVYSEILEAYYSQKPTLIFKRTKNNYEFNSEKRILEDIALKNTQNKLFLSTATIWNYEKTKDIFDWFMNKVYFFGGTIIPVPNDYLSGFKEENSDLKSFALKILNEADIQIKNINVESKKIDVSNFINPFENLNSFSGSKKETVYKVDFVHEVEDESGKINTFSLNINKESDGTRGLFNFIPYIKKALEDDCLVIFDELERSLHPMLVEYIVKLFNNDTLNKYSSQIVFTTHLTNLLNIKLFRRDQIWFIEKNAKTGNSDLYPLDAFSIRKDENILKGYLNGRYGAVPYIKEEVVW